MHSREHIEKHKKYLELPNELMFIGPVRTAGINSRIAEF